MTRNARCLMIPIIITLMVCVGVALSGCFREAAELIDAGTGCLRAQGCWR